MSCPGGRWGPRRVRVTECVAVVRAEDLYTTLHEDKSGPKEWGPGSRGTAIFRIYDRDLTAQWEIRPNPVWRRGRVFFTGLMQVAVVRK